MINTPDLDDLQLLWDCRSDRLDSLMASREPLLHTAPTAELQRYEQRANLRCFAVAACLVLLLAPIATATAANIPHQSMRVAADSNRQTTLVTANEVINKLR